jgi:hypothetical protein
VRRLKTRLHVKEITYYVGIGLLRRRLNIDDEYEKEEGSAFITGRVTLALSASIVLHNFHHHVVTTHHRALERHLVLRLLTVVF